MSACLASSKTLQRTAALPRSAAHTARPVAHVVKRGRVVLARAEPTKQEVQPSNMAVAEAMAAAEAACSDPNSSECKAAWDVVEEVSAHASHQKAALAAQDPMDKFCEGNEDADECRVYDN